MTEPVSSDIILVNRGGIDYQTSIGESFPSTDQLPLIPGPPVIALNGQPQVEPAEPNEPIVIIREGEGPAPRASQWQRGASGAWNNIAGETGVDYIVTSADTAVNIRLKQTFSDGSELYSNEIIVTDEIPLPWDDWNGGVWHIKNATGTVQLEGGPYVAWNIDGANQREIAEVAVAEELVFVTGPSAASLFEENTSVEWDFGDLTDTSNVTNMVMMFDGASAFNSDLNMFDVSNVKTMWGMFYNARAFNSDISNWDVGNVTEMERMFWNATVFNSDISNWDVSNVTTTRVMFFDATAFNSDISNWDVSNLKIADAMFLKAQAFNSDISKWNVSNVTDMQSMFQHARAFNQDISTKQVIVNGNTYTAWDVSNVGSSFQSGMSNMFWNATAFNQDISNWDVSNVTNMYYMFYNAQVFNQDLSNWCVSPEPRHDSFKSLSAMPTDGSYDPCWGHCPPKGDPCPMPWEGHDGGIWHIKNVAGEKLTINNGPYGEVANFTAWDTDGTNQREIDSVEVGQELVFVTPSNCSTLFGGNDNTSWSFGQYTNTSNVTIMRSLFDGSPLFDNDISDWDVSNVTDIIGMFWRCVSFDQNISSWDVSNVTKMDGVFADTTSFNQDLSDWCVTNITSKPDRFDENATNWSEDRPCWGHCPPKGDPCPVMPWEGEDGIYHVILNDPADIRIANQSKIYNLANQAEVSSISADGEWIITGKNTRFQYSSGNWDFGDLTDTSNATNMSAMFKESQKFNSDISNWDVSNVTNMYDMFDRCRAFNSDISNWDVSNVTNMSNMFFNAHVFNRDISNWDVSNVTRTSSMFKFAFAFNQDINTKQVTVNGSTYTAWDVGNVTDMSNMFDDASTFNQNIGNWDVSKVTNMRSMFVTASAFNKDINTKQVTVNGNTYTAWDVGNVTDMGAMFNNVKVFSQDISNWDVGNVVTMAGMFYNAQAFNSDISNWDVGNVTNATNMFKYAYVFNTDISDWDVGNVTNMRYMFDGAKVFNQDINTKQVTVNGNTYTAWDTSNVTNMGYMFLNAQAFNSDISNWDVGNVTGMAGMFYNARVFNLDINTKQVTVGGNTYTAWDTSSVTNMSCMFRGDLVFNQNISNWVTSNATDMNGMFFNARQFRQDLTGWCVPKIISEPANFKKVSSMPTDGSYDPKWGTCPPRQVTTLNYTVTVADTGYGNKYYLNGNEQQSIYVIVGETIVFDQSDSTNTGHPLRIYTDEARTTEYTTGVTVNGTTITFVVSESGTFYYQCQAHAGMGGQIVVS